MKKALFLVIVAVLLATGFAGGAVAGSGDENYNGEDGDQPALGADDSAGPGEPNTGAASDTGDRTRHKDS
ncbi:MAG: hypothetical protein GXY82_08270 [Methanospirillum sp.]|nr:hypothetical protein [Methanospirillum sp.]